MTDLPTRSMIDDVSGRTPIFSALHVPGIAGLVARHAVCWYARCQIIDAEYANDMD